jgi:tetratricopeptide (TPR) repeat protein
MGIFSYFFKKRRASSQLDLATSANMVRMYQLLGDDLGAQHPARIEKDPLGRVAAELVNALCGLASERTDFSPIQEEIFQSEMKSIKTRSDAVAREVMSLGSRSRSNNAVKLIMARQFGQAQLILQEATAMDPGNSSALASLGFLALRQGLYDECIDLCERALEHDRTNAEAYRLLGNACDVRARELKATDPNKAALYQSMAKEAWDSARVLNPNIVGIPRWLF